MPQGIQIVDLDDRPKAVRKFFESLGDQPIIVERDGRAVYVIRPASAVVSGSTGDQSRLAGEVLSDVHGAWSDIPDETLDAIAAGNRA